MSVHDAVVVGSGFGGLAAAIELRRTGLADVVVLEKADDLGGTWRDNRYPGCACDVPSHLYSFSFAPSARWSRAFAEQPEIWDYLRRVAHDFGVTERIRYGEELVEALYEDGIWRLTTERGTKLEARSLVLATGALSEPALPSIEGLDSFGGSVFHTANWPDDDTAAIDGQRVAVIGTGASAIQAVPRLAPRASHLTVLQRTPPWILPKGDREIGRREQDWLERVPALNWLVRAGVYWRNESRVMAFTSRPGIMKVLERIGLYHLRKQVTDPAVRKALTPTYRMGCKRILISNDYLPTFNRPDVTLVTDPIERIEPDAVITADGRRHEVDTLVLSTGFAATEPYQHLTVRGPSGQTLREAWAEGMQAHLGITVAGFPNLFLVVGPNTGLGHNSMVFMIEAQTRYLAQCVAMRDQAGARSIGVPQQVQDEFNAELAERHQAHGVGDRLPQLVPRQVRQQPSPVAGVQRELLAAHPAARPPARRARPGDSGAGAHGQRRGAGVRRQVALVTGGASGIGRSLAAALATRGHDVVIADVDGAAASETAQSLAADAAPSGGRVAAVTLDVTDRAAFAAVAQQVAADHGSLDLLFNNAGIGVGGLVDELGDEHWDRCLAVNLHGVVHGVQAAVPIMTAQGSGHIVNTASMAGLMTVPMMLPYTTTKHAVVALSRALRAELKPVGVGVTAVCPAFIATPLLDNLNPGMGANDATRAVRQMSTRLQPRGLPSPDELAVAVLRGVAKGKALVVFPRYQWGVVAAQRWAPALVERAIDREVRTYRARRRSATLV